MRRFKLFGLAVLAVFAATAVVTASASAVAPLPQVLPTTITEWHGTQVGVASLEQSESGLKIECSGGSGLGVIESSRTLGLFHITFTGCKALSGQCTGLGDATAGTILTLGLWHSVIDVDEPNLAAAILFLIEEVHFSCGIVLIKVKGSVLCLVLEPLALTLEKEFHCTQKVGVPDEKTYQNDLGQLVEDTKLESSTSEAAFKGAGELALAKLKGLPEGIPWKIDD